MSDIKIISERGRDLPTTNKTWPELQRLNKQQMEAAAVSDGGEKMHPNIEIITKKWFTFWISTAVSCPSNENVETRKFIFSACRQFPQAG